MQLDSIMFLETETNMATNEETVETFQDNCQKSFSIVNSPMPENKFEINLPTSKIHSPWVTR